VVSGASSGDPLSIPLLLILAVSTVVGLGLFYLDYRNWRHRGK